MTNIHIILPVHYTGRYGEPILAFLRKEDAIRFIGDLEVYDDGIVKINNQSYYLNTLVIVGCDLQLIPGKILT